MKKSFAIALLALMGLTLVATDARAGEWGLGVGVAAQQPPQVGTSTETVVLPFPSYQGERLSLDFGSVGYALVNTDRVRFAVEGQLRFDGYDPAESTELSGLRERDVTLDAGFSIATGDKWGIASFQVMADALGIHKGYEMSASYQYPIQLGRWTLVPGITAKWPSEELVEYYYGVRLDEATPDRPAYSGRAVFNASAALNASYTLTDSWELIGGAEYTRLGDGITDSPIIEKDHEVIMYSAIVYRF